MKHITNLTKERRLSLMKSRARPGGQSLHEAQLALHEQSVHLQRIGVAQHAEAVVLSGKSLRALEQIGKEISHAGARSA